MSRLAASTRAQRAVSASSVTVTFFMTRFWCYTRNSCQPLVNRTGRRSVTARTAGTTGLGRPAVSARRVDAHEPGKKWLGPNLLEVRAGGLDDSLRHLVGR
jgi:hypothetical protein